MSPNNSLIKTYYLKFYFLYIFVVLSLFATGGQSHAQPLRKQSEGELLIADEPYEDRYSTCFACYITLSTNVMNKNLYDDTSKPALVSAIHLVMTEPKDSITYDRDPDNVCDWTGENNIVH